MHRIVDSRCVLAVRDLKGSTQFYIDVLGFRRDFGDGSNGWSFLSRDNFKPMLSECPDEAGNTIVVKAPRRSSSADLRGP